MDVKPEEDVQNNTNPQRVSRRSIRSSSDVRHGRVYEDEQQNARTTTQELGPFPALESGADSSVQLSPPSTSSPRYYRPHAVASPPTAGRETSASVSNTDDDSAPEARRRKVQKKPKTKVEGITDASPSSFISKTRQRLGSITTAAQLAEVTSSPAHSSNAQAKVPAPGHGDVRGSQSRSQRRTFSTDSTVALDSLRSSMSLSPNSSHILQLMKTTCGRMHGILFFRALGTSSWESGYCAINMSPGSLICQKQGEQNATKILMPDLRGCSVRTNYDAESQSKFISVVMPASGYGFQLRPPVPETFDSWLAALLCWQPLRPKGVHNKMMKTNSVLIAEKRLTISQPPANSSSPRSNAIVKVGRMVLWDGHLPSGSQRYMSRRSSDFDALDQSQLWRRVSCTLHDSGTFKLLTEIDAQPICVIMLSSLSRYAIQRLDKSVLDTPYCLAIHPEYSVDTGAKISSRPIILGLESKSAHEAWYVLLRALTVPELYGPERPFEQKNGNGGIAVTADAPKNMFRIERNLTVKVTEAKLNRDLLSYAAQGTPSQQPRHTQRGHSDIDLYAEVSCDRDIRARTNTRPYSASAFWAAEFMLSDLPPAMSTVAVAVKVGNPAEQEWTMVTPEAYDLTAPNVGKLPGLSGLEIASSDPEVGIIEIEIEQLDDGKILDKWWPLQDKNGTVVGQLLLKLALTENIVLMQSEYTTINNLLHAIDTGLTAQIAHFLPQDLKQMSELLLDIFQASGKAHDWICTLVEDEIDGIYKDMPPGHIRFSGRMQSNDSYESSEQREMLVRDLSRSASQEANLLFRGNSLVTKALDAYMKRLGKDYLEQTLGAELRQIVVMNPDCEVDPLKVQDSHQLELNWVALMSLTNSIWRAIASSASKCPAAMRILFQHIRSCAEDRYGSFIRTVKYTSVSGFLFLRFFCPAILNPNLFGLIDSLPSERVRRTFVLIAKSLNVLASMARFGNKETWMEPMNKFVLGATPDFKRFIDASCSIRSSESVDVLEPQYLAPMQIRSRLSTVLQEGLPTLPYLLDRPRSIANLVDLWLSRVPTSFTRSGSNDTLWTFHEACLKLRQQTKDCVTKAEPAEKPSTTQEAQWQRILSEQQQSQRRGDSVLDNTFAGFETEEDITALPQRSESLANRRPADVSGVREGIRALSLRSSEFSDGRRIPYGGTGGASNGGLTMSNNSSTTSLGAADEIRRPNSSRENGSKPRLFEYLNPSRRKV